MFAIVVFGLSACRDAPASSTDDLVQAASSFAHADYPKAGRLEATGNIKCIVRRARSVAVAERRFVLAVTSASHDKACLEEHGIFLSVTPSEPEMQVGVRLSGSAEGTFGYRTHSVPQEPVDARERRIASFLAGLISADPFAAAELPPWQQGELQPSLPDDLAFQPLTDRETYEAVRKQDQFVFCWKKDETELRCTALAPRRRPSQIDLFIVHGFNDFREMDVHQAIHAVVSGKATTKL
ncbi:hypothetical protein DBR41_23405 [Pseudomonas sp. HMWF010]|nr:hypothetical protein DBR41_23405 [Pseudomonas sp. HMWF010]